MVGVQPPRCRFLSLIVGADRTDRGLAVAAPYMGAFCAAPDVVRVGRVPYSAYRPEGLAEWPVRILDQLCGPFGGTTPRLRAAVAAPWHHRVTSRRRSPAVASACVRRSKPRGFWCHLSFLPQTRGTRGATNDAACVRQWPPARPCKACLPP